jgi:16S rRNA (adenine1518-N6/adenine1519-N6)-dimethyltransferase
VTAPTPERGRRPPWSEFRAALEAAGFRPSRRLGQNFLLDENLVRAIVRDAGVGPGDFVLEVGPGLGFLSLQLARAGVELVGVEIDERLLALARSLLASEPAAAARVRWIAGDVLAGKHELDARVRAALPASGPWHLVANLPYGVSAPLLIVLAELENPPASMTVLVQLEVAERIVARPGSADWGALSIRLQLDYDAHVVRRVAPQLFWPRPEVESALVRLVARPVRAPAGEREALAALVARLFQRRRQALGRVLSEIVGDRARAQALLAAGAIDPRTRAEDLSLESLRALARSIAGTA